MFRKTAFAAAVLSFLSLPVLAAPFQIDPNHTFVDFRIRHLISGVHGSFDRFEGQFELDSKTETVSNIRFTIWTDSINTRNSKRDSHLKSADFFEVEKYPTMTFVGTSTEQVDGNVLTIQGDLTMHGVTRPVSLTALYNGVTTVNGKQIASFAATTVLDRKAFGINWNRALDNGGVILGDDVLIEVSVEAVNG
ncbi:MAG: YceI family protein [Candidatus Margulisiibacteriota bacterium]